MAHPELTTRQYRVLTNLVEGLAWNYPIHRDSSYRPGLTLTMVSLVNRGLVDRDDGSGDWVVTESGRKAHAEDRRSQGHPA